MSSGKRMSYMAAKTRKWDDIYKNLSSLTQEDRDEIEYIVRKWDSDFTKLTPLERERLTKAEKEIENREIVKHSEIDWD